METAKGTPTPWDESNLPTTESKAKTGQVKSLRLEKLQRLGDFVIDEQLGKGGMGVVFKATQISLQRKVALKVLPRSMAEDQNFCQRFLVEARSAASLMHPNVIQVFTVGMDDQTNRLYFAMELIDGEPLDQYLKKGDPSFGQALHIAISVADALEHAWERKLIHRDIKPSNVMLGPKNLVKVLDFGLAKSVQAQSGLTRTGTIIGTPDYMSPEQAGARETDCRSDIYSLGVLLHRMVAGARPFIADSVAGLIFLHSYARPRRINFYRKNVPAELNTILAKMLAKEPADRYPDPSALLADLQALRKKLEREGKLDLKPSGERVPSITFKEGQSQLDKGDLLDLKAAGPLDTRPMLNRRNVAPASGGGAVKVVLVVLMLALLGGAAWAFFTGRLDPWLGDASAGGNTGNTANAAANTGDAANAGPAVPAETAEVVAPAPEIALDELVWGAPEPVWDAATRSVPSTDRSKWNFNVSLDFPEALVGVGTGFLERPVEAPAWRLRGLLVEFGAKDFGLYLLEDGAPGRGIAIITFDQLNYLRSVDRWKDDGSRSKGTPESQSFDEMKAPFSLTVAGRRVVLEVDGEVLLDEQVEGAIDGFCLYIDAGGGQAGFCHLTLEEPAE